MNISSFPKKGINIYMKAAIKDPNPSIIPATRAVMFFYSFTSSYFASSIAIAPPIIVNGPPRLTPPKRINK